MEKETAIQVIVEPGDSPVAVTPINVWDLDPATFKAALEVRKTNRKTLIAWVRDALVYGEDYGRIHVVGASTCSNRGNSCSNEQHFSNRPSLFKPGAEKILAYMGITPDWPALSAYQQRVLDGAEVLEILLECRGMIGGQVVAVGAGARHTERDARQGYRDLNKTIKMVKKSAMIDMVLTLGFSEVFTQDLEDMPPTGEISADELQRTTAIHDLQAELDKMFPPHGADGVAGVRYHGRILLGLTPIQLKDLADWLVVYKRHQKELADCEAAGMSNEDIVSLYQARNVPDPEVASRDSLFDFNETLRLHCSIIKAAKVMDSKAVEAIKNTFLTKFESDNLEALDNLQLVQIRTELVAAYRQANGK